MITQLSLLLYMLFYTGCMLYNKTNTSILIYQFQASVLPAWKLLISEDLLTSQVVNKHCICICDKVNWPATAFVVISSTTIGTHMHSPHTRLIKLLTSFTTSILNINEWSIITFSADTHFKHLPPCTVPTKGMTTLFL